MPLRQRSAALLAALNALALLAPAQCVSLGGISRPTPPRHRPRLSVPPLMLQDSGALQQDRWQDLALVERFPRLQNLSNAVLVRRTVGEAELAIKLEGEFNTDPSILQVSTGF